MAEPIVNQTRIPPEQWRYGLRASAKTGCGWIALYNALLLLGEQPEPEDLIRALEKQLPLIHGNAGTTCLGPALLLKKWGYPVTISSDVSRFDGLARQADAAILFYYWRRGLRIGAHFVALQATPQGFVGYNTYTTSASPDSYGTSLPKYLKRQGYFGCILTAVKKKTFEKDSNADTLML